MAASGVLARPPPLPPFLLTSVQCSHILIIIILRAPRRYYHMMDKMFLRSNIEIYEYLLLLLLLVVRTFMTVAKLSLESI